MNIWMIEETREIAQTLQSVVSGWALTSMPAFCFYTRKRRCYSRWNDNTPFWLVDQEQNSIWFVWVSPAPCISPLRELSLTSDRSAVVFFFLRLWHRAPPGECSRPPLWEPLLYRIKYKSVQWWVVFFMHFKHSFLCRSRYFIFAVFICRSVKIMPTLNRSVVQKRLGTPALQDLHPKVWTEFLS